MATRDHCVGAVCATGRRLLRKTALQQQLQRPESRGIKRISADVVEAEIVGGGIGLAGCPRIVPFIRENVVHRGTSCKGGKC